MTKLPPARRSSTLARVLHALAGMPGSKFFMRLHVAIYRATTGRLMRRWFGYPVIVIETVGCRTGRPRSVSVVYAPHPGGWIVSSANGGLDRRPAWVANLRRAGQATVYESGEAHRVTSREPTGSEAEVLWDAYLRAVPTVRDYQQMTSRPFDLFLLERSSV